MVTLLRRYLEILLLLVPVLLIAGAVVFSDDDGESHKNKSEKNDSYFYKETIQKVKELITETEKLKITLADEPTLKELSSKVFCVKNLLI